MAYIQNMNQEPLNNFFGKDTKRIFEAAEQVKCDWLYPYGGCYNAYQVFRAIEPVECGVLPAYKAFLAEHPEEALKVEASREAWRAKNAKAFRRIYGIAKRHHCYLKWHGRGAVSCGDQWTIYKGGHAVARLLC